MATFGSDTFTGVSGTTLASHTPDAGTSWTKHPSSVAAVQISNANRARLTDNSGIAIYYNGGVPASADYTTTADFVAQTLSGLASMGVTGRMATGANTFYMHYAYGGDGSSNLYKVIAGTQTQLGTFATGFTSGTKSLRLSMVGTTISALVDSVSRISVTDSAISATGKAGIYLNAQFDTVDDTHGYHIDNFAAADPVVPAGPSPAKVYGIGLTTSMPNVTAAIARAANWIVGGLVGGLHRRRLACPA